MCVSMMRFDFVVVIDARQWQRFGSMAFNQWMNEWANGGKNKQVDIRQFDRMNLFYWGLRGDNCVDVVDEQDVDVVKVVDVDKVEDEEDGSVLMGIDEATAIGSVIWGEKIFNWIGWNHQQFNTPP